MNTEKYPRCTTVLREAGGYYPRTCAECGLGPCKRQSAPAAPPVAESAPASIDTDMKIALMVTRGDLTEVKRWGAQQRREGQRDAHETNIDLVNQNDKLRQQYNAVIDKYNDAMLRAEKAEAALVDSNLYAKELEKAIEVWKACAAPSPVDTAAQVVAWLNYNEHAEKAGEFPWMLMLNQDHPSVIAKSRIECFSAAPAVTAAQELPVLPAIEPCPFCDEETALEVFEHGKGTEDYDAYVQCQTCTACGPGGVNWKGEAIVRWNSANIRTRDAWNAAIEAVVKVVEQHDGYSGYKFDLLAAIRTLKKG